MNNFLHSLRDFAGHLRFLRHTPGVLPKIIAGVIMVNIFKKPRLRVVEIAVDYVCNGKCLFCSASKLLDPEKEKHRLSVFEYQKLGKVLDRLGVVGIVITGGEPLLRPDLPEIIKALDPQNKIISVVTNSLLLTPPKIKALKKAGVNALEFSLESIDEEENDKIRGTKGHFQKVLQGIKLAKEADINICLSPCLTHQNINQFAQFIQFAKSQNAFILLSLGGDVGRASGQKNIVLTEKDWGVMEKYRRKYPFIRNDFSTNFILKEGCPAGREKLYLSPYGDVIPCSFTHLSFGNIREEPLETIWQKMREFPPYKKYFPYCRRTRDRKYAKKYLDPLKKAPYTPYPVEKLLQ